MTLQISQPADKNLQAELDRLTYSAYLLTLDPGVAFSVVMRDNRWIDRAPHRRSRFVRTNSRTLITAVTQ
jgi:hypothetical protein